MINSDKKLLESLITKYGKSGVNSAINRLINATYKTNMLFEYKESDDIVKRFIKFLHDNLDNYIDKIIINNDSYWIDKNNTRVPDDVKPEKIKNYPDPWTYFKSDTILNIRCCFSNKMTKNNKKLYDFVNIIKDTEFSKIVHRVEVFYYDNYNLRGMTFTIFNNTHQIDNITEFYHVTDKKNIKNILYNGLIPNNETFRTKKNPQNIFSIENYTGSIFYIFPYKSLFCFSNKRKAKFIAQKMLNIDEPCLITIKYDNRYMTFYEDFLGNLDDKSKSCVYTYDKISPNNITSIMDMNTKEIIYKK